jgi:hypothetical protein
MDDEFREHLHRVIDELSPGSLASLSEFVMWLQHQDRLMKEGSRWANVLYESFAPIREGVLVSGMTEEEINRLLDEALAGN